MREDDTTLVTQSVVLSNEDPKSNTMKMLQLICENMPQTEANVERFIEERENINVDEQNKTFRTKS